MKPIKILQISNLLVTKEGGDAVSVLDDLGTLLGGTSEGIDYIVVCGNLTRAGRPAEFDRAREAGDDLYTSEVDIEFTETDGTDDQQEIIRKGIRGLKVDTALRDLWERHSVDWSRLKDRKRHRSVPRKE